MHNTFYSSHLGKEACCFFHRGQPRKRRGDEALLPSFPSVQIRCPFLFREKGRGFSTDGNQENEGEMRLCYLRFLLFKSGVHSSSVKKDKVFSTEGNQENEGEMRIS